jgi:hypothetical protein
MAEAGLVLLVLPQLLGAKLVALEDKVLSLFRTRLGQRRHQQRLEIL